MFIACSCWYVRKTVIVDDNVELMFQGTWGVFVDRDALGSYQCDVCKNEKTQEACLVKIDPHIFSRILSESNFAEHRLYSLPFQKCVREIATLQGRISTRDQGHRGSRVGTRIMRSIFARGLLCGCIALSIRRGH